MPGRITVFLLEVDKVPYVDVGPSGEGQNLNTKQTDKTVKPGHTCTLGLHSASLIRPNTIRAQQGIWMGKNALLF